MARLPLPRSRFDALTSCVALIGSNAGYNIRPIHKPRGSHESSDHQKNFMKVVHDILQFAAAARAGAAPHPPQQPRSRTNPFHALWLLAGVLLILSQTHLAKAEPGNTVTNSNIEQCKSFISSPPIIEELIWELKIAPPGKRHNPEDDLGASTNFQRFIARWQPDARFVYQVFPEYVSTNTVMNWTSVSVFGSKHWQMDPSGTLILWHDDGSPPPRKASVNFAESSVSYLTYRLAEVLNMGVFNLGISSIRWQGDTFSATNSKIGLRFHGLLHASPDGIPSHLDLQAQIGTNSRALAVLYSFDRDTGLPYLPNQIRVTESMAGKERERALIKIKSIKLASQPAAEEAFLPKTNLLGVPVQLRFYTNGAYYALSDNGRLVRSPLAANHYRNVEPSRRAYLVVCAAVSLAIFVLMARAKSKTNQPLQTEQAKEHV